MGRSHCDKSQYQYQRHDHDGWIQGYTIPGHELIAPKDATIVTKLRGAGAVILGQTNMPDFAASDTNRSSAFGRTGNAYDVRFSPGGSSGGTVTAVTSSYAVLGNGTDTGNSIRMPSATSSVVGVFPTRGLVSIAGIAPLDWLLDNTGPIARNVTDAAIALGVMAGEDPLDPPTTGSSVPAVIIGASNQGSPEPSASKDRKASAQAIFETDPQADANVLKPRHKALEAYNETLDRLHLDGYVYPAAQMPPPDETMPQDGHISGGPHSATG